MFPLPIALDLARRSVEHEFGNARPDGPTVEAPAAERRPATRRTRLRLAAVLHRVAAAVEPADCARTPNPAR